MKKPENVVQRTWFSPYSRGKTMSPSCSMDDPGMTCWNHARVKTRRMNIIELGSICKILRKFDAGSAVSSRIPDRTKIINIAGSIPRQISAKYRLNAQGDCPVGREKCLRQSLKPSRHWEWELFNSWLFKIRQELEFVEAWLQCECILTGEHFGSERFPTGSRRKWQGISGT